MRAAENVGMIPRRLSWRGFVATVSIAMGFLAFGAFISYVAPVQVLVLQRDDQRAVRAEVTQRMWLIVPHRTRLLRNINGVSTRTLQQPTYREPARPDGLDARTITPEQEGVLILRGGNGTLELSVSPIDLDRTESRVSRFLTSSDRGLRLWLVSNWKVAVVAQAIVILPALLILLGLAWDVAALAMSAIR
jgi:hypothetical protein